MFGDETMVKLLLENGANIESSDERGMTPLKLAARHGHEIVEVGSVSRGTLKGGYVTTYWGAKPRKAKLTRTGNSQVRRLHDLSHRQVAF